jgi:hypothetical protein
VNSTFAMVLRVLFIVISFIIVPLSLWFATGFIGEYGDDAPMFIAPGYLIPLVLWIVGFIIHFFKKYFHVGMVMMGGPLLFYVVLFTMAAFY